MAEHLGAEERAAAQLLEQRGELGVIRLRRDRAEGLALGCGALDIRRDCREERIEAGESAFQSAPREREPALAIASELVDTLEHRRGRICLEVFAGRIDPTFRDGSDLDLRVVDPAKGRVLQHPAEVVEDNALVRPVRRHAIDHDEHGQPARRDPLHHVEGRLVGIADRRRDENPEVGGLDERVRDDAVGALDAIEVRGVDDRHARRCRRGRRADDLTGIDAGEGATPEDRRVGVGGEEDGLARGRPKHARAADGRARQGVHQR